MLSLMEEGYLSSPATTPDAFFDEDKFLVKSIVSKSNEPSRKIKWYHYSNLPLAIMSVSLCQVITTSLFIFQETTEYISLDHFSRLLHLSTEQTIEI